MLEMISEPYSCCEVISSNTQENAIFFNHWIRVIPILMSGCCSFYKQWLPFDLLSVLPMWGRGTLRQVCEGFKVM